MGAVTLPLWLLPAVHVVAKLVGAKTKSILAKTDCLVKLSIIIFLTSLERYNSNIKRRKLGFYRIKQWLLWQRALALLRLLDCLIHQQPDWPARVHLLR